MAPGVKNGIVPLIARTQARAEVGHYRTRCMARSESTSPQAECILAQPCTDFCTGLGSCFYPMTYYLMNRNVHCLKITWNMTSDDSAHSLSPHAAVVQVPVQTDWPIHSLIEPQAKCVLAQSSTEFVYVQFLHGPGLLLFSCIFCEL